MAKTKKPSKTLRILRILAFFANFILCNLVNLDSELRPCVIRDEKGKFSRKRQLVYGYGRIYTESYDRHGIQSCAFDRGMPAPNPIPFSNGGLPARISPPSLFTETFVQPFSMPTPAKLLPNTSYETTAVLKEVGSSECLNGPKTPSDGSSTSSKTLLDDLLRSILGQNTKLTKTAAAQNTPAFDDFSREYFSSIKKSGKCSSGNSTRIGSHGQNAKLTNAATVQNSPAFNDFSRESFSSIAKSGKCSTGNSSRIGGYGQKKRFKSNETVAPGSGSSEFQNVSGLVSRDLQHT